MSGQETQAARMARLHDLKHTAAGLSVKVGHLWSRVSMLQGQADNLYRQLEMARLEAQQADAELELLNREIARLRGQL